MPLGPADVPAAVLAVLADGQSQGLIGPGPLEPHVQHALGFLEAMVEIRGAEPSTSDRVADLGPGAGLPGLVLASVVPTTAFTFVEGSTRRAAFLRAAVEGVRLENVTVVGQRAELAGRDSRLRGQHSVVVARAFGTPGETVECGAPLLSPGGLLIVSEPPSSDGPGRWPEAGLALLGLEATTRHAPGYAAFHASTPCPDAYPRRVGVPRKRPLF